MSNLVVKLKSRLPVREVGGKGHSLGVLLRSNFDVPDGFVITCAAFLKALEYNNLMGRVEKLAAEITQNNFRETSAGIKELILGSEIQEDIVSKIQKALKKLNAQYVSVRSSAVSEDSLKASFAGLHDTFLNVKADLDIVLENLKKCWASLFNERAIIYRVKKGIPHLEGIAIVIQEMIPAEISGITFTVHPTDEKSLLMEASYGIGDMVVSGKVEPDEYVVDRETLEITGKKIGRKNKMSTVEIGEIKVIDAEMEFAKKYAISDENIKEIASTCLNVEEIFKYPQDIEWCMYNSKIYLLQSRAITG